MAVERKYERDIDLLLAEELVVHPAFAAWLARAAGLAAATGRLVDVWVSKADNLGESDLIALFDGDDGVRTALMIEDKVDAPLQPDQARRYRLRGEREIAAGLCGRVRTMLCAPAGYLAYGSAAAGFDAQISFEEIANFLRSADPTARGTYRADFLETAARRRANHWQREVDEQTEVFWRSAYDLASRIFPELEMKPLAVTKGSTWITFRPRDLPTRPHHTYVSVKGDRGQMDLTFSNTALGPFRAKVEALLEPDMTLHQTSASTAVRLTVEGFQTADPIGGDMPKVRAAFAACSRLIDFYRRHRESLDAAAIDAAQAATRSR